MREPVVARLVARRADGDPRPRLKSVLDGWRAEAAQESFAVDVFGLASQRGIRVRRTEPKDWEGRIFVDSAGRVTVEIDGRHKPPRQRFTLAHELVHTAFPGFTADRRYRIDENLADALFARNRREEERLCDWGAGVLLMPEEWMWSYRVGQGVRSFERLARDAKVSLEAAAKRIVEVSPSPAVLIVADESSRGQLKVRHADTGRLSVFVPRGAPLPDDTVFARAVRSGKAERENTTLPGRSRRLFHIEAKSFPYGSGVASRERVMALAWPVNHPPTDEPDART